MTVLKVLEVELLVVIGAFALSYCVISLLLWHLGRASERRMRERAARDAAPDSVTGKR
jgi:hypothetical protein